MLHKDKKKESYVKWVVYCAVALLITILTVYLTYHSVVAIVYGVYAIVMVPIVFAGNLDQLRNTRVLSALRAAIR